MRTRSRTYLSYDYVEDTPVALKDHVSSVGKVHQDLTENVESLEGRLGMGKVYLITSLLIRCFQPGGPWRYTRIMKANQTEIYLTCSFFFSRNRLESP